MPSLFFDSREALVSARGEMTLRAEALRAQTLYAEAEADGESTQHGRYHLPGDQLTEVADVLGALGGEENLNCLSRALGHYAAYHKWIGSELLRRDPPWHSELNTARFLYGFSLGYDCARDSLAPGERRAIALAAKDKGILPTLRDWLLPGTRIHSMESMGHNWWAVCVSAAGLGIIAFREELPELMEHLPAVEAGLCAFFSFEGSALFNKPPNFDPAGAMAEGVNYLNYALGELLAYRLAFDRAFGTKPHGYDAALSRALDYLKENLIPAPGGWRTPNAGDSSTRVDFSRTLALAVLCGFEKPWMHAFLRLSPPNPLWLRALLPGVEGEAPVFSPAVAYPASGKALLRSGDAVLHVTCGSTWNHTHADAGGFLLFANGEPVLTDGGSCSYAHPAYPQYYCQSAAHNVLLFNGHGQPFSDHYYGAKNQGQVLDLAAGERLRFLLCDAQGPMSRWFSRHYRSFLFYGDVLLIWDDVRAHEPGEPSCLFHGPNLVEADGELRAGDVRVVPLLPRAGRWEAREGRREKAPEEPEPCYARAVPITPVHITRLDPGDPNHLAAGEPVCAQKLMNAVLLSPDARAEAREHEGYIEARLFSRGREARVVFNLNADGRKMHLNSFVQLGGLETDAYLLMEDENELLMAQGSCVRRDGRSLHESLARQTRVLTKGR